MFVLLDKKDVPLLDTIHESLERADRTHSDAYNRLGCIIATLRGEDSSNSPTKDPVYDNFNPDDAEMKVRLAVHLLSDFSTDVDVTLKMDENHHVYLIASVLGDDHDDDESEIDGKTVITPRPRGTVEYQVSDGPAGERSHSHDFYNLKDALAHFNEVVEHGGWKGWSEWVQRAI